MAHTCFNQLLLPPYGTRQQLESKLIIAISNAEGFGLEWLAINVIKLCLFDFALPSSFFFLTYDFWLTLILFVKIFCVCYITNLLLLRCFYFFTVIFFCFRLCTYLTRHILLLIYCFLLCHFYVDNFHFGKQSLIFNFNKCRKNSKSSVFYFILK